MLSHFLFTITVLLHRFHQGGCNVCCNDGEVFLMQETRCQAIENVAELEKMTNKMLCTSNETEKQDCYGIIPHLEDGESLSVKCTITALDADKPAYATVFEGDLRHHFTNSSTFCTGEDEILTVQNKCQKHRVILVENQTLVVTSILKKMKRCGPELRYCQKETAGGRKFPKCCGLGFIYNSNFTCIRTEQQFTPSFTGASTDGDTEIIPPKIIAAEGFDIVIDTKNDYFIDARNGYLARRDGMNFQTLMHPFCIDGMQYENGTVVQVIIKEMEKPPMLSKSADLTFLSFETIFMGLTFLVHLLLPKFKNLPGTIILLYTGTYLVWDFLRIHLTLSGEITAWFCFIHLVALPYLNWSKCWWLFLFTFELLLRIKQKKRSSEADERKRLIIYCFIAWILNGLIVFGICITQGIVFHDFRLLRGDEGCNFLNRGLEPIMTSYIMLTPCTISGIVDMILLIFVTRIIQETSKKLDASQDCQKKQLQQRFKLLVRLYTLGITKLMYSTTEICAMYLPNFEFIRHVTLCVVQLIYAFVIFAIFCCKKSVFRDIWAVGKNKLESITSNTYTLSTASSKKDSVAMSKSDAGEESVALNIHQKV